MYYQKLLSDERPYIAQVFSTCVFDLHKHCELEIIYCVKGRIFLSMDQIQYTVTPGQVILVSPLVSHKATCEEKTEVLLIKVGPTLLRSLFSAFFHHSFVEPVFTVENQYMASLLGSVYEHCGSTDSAAELQTIGCIYQLCAFLVEQNLDFSNANASDAGSRKKLEEVFQLVFLHYASPIRVENAAQLSGYSVGNFCKLFKATTGKGFHAYLNDYRIQKAELLLLETELPISHVAAEVGFLEIKTFCRLFKEKNKITPTEYRNTRS